MTPKLHCLTSGNSSSPAIVFLHGFLGSSSDWEEILSDFSEEFYCVAPDLPGHGQTAKSSNPEAYSMRGGAAAIQNTMDRLGVANCALVGYSMGGRLALYLAMTCPQRWTRLVIESASPGIEDFSERAKRQELDEKKAQELEAGNIDAFLQSWYEQPLFESLKRNSARFSRLLERRRSNDPAELAISLRGMGAGVQPSLWNELPRLKTPLLVMAGEQDAKYRQIAEKILRSSKEAFLAVVPGSGHNAHVENPVEYTKVLRQFLTAPLR